MSIILIIIIILCNSTLNLQCSYTAETINLY
jgi:hypothetical protein